MIGDVVPGQVDEGEQVRGREDLAEHLEGLFAPAHAGEPVVDERYTQTSDHSAAGSKIPGMADAGSDKAFTGSIPKIYETYLVPLIFEHYAADLAARVAARLASNAVEASPKHVLEIAAGTGVVTRAMLRALARSAEIVATDLNPAMLEQAAAHPLPRPVRSSRRTRWTCPSTTKPSMSSSFSLA